MNSQADEKSSACFFRLDNWAGIDIYPPERFKADFIIETFMAFRSLYRWVNRMEANGNTHLKAGGMDLALWVIAIVALVVIGSYCFELFLMD